MPEAPRHEQQDIQVGKVMLVTGAIGVLVLVTCGLAWISLRAVGARDIEGSTPSGTPRPEVLLPDPHVALDEYQRAKRAEVASYAWDDTDHRHARVPIDVAIDALAARNSKARSP